ncbi:MAG TPA: hypothetical protein VMR21_12140 [Vicinamibacteria bacterium]|nr:hypothetical protein [Vicinamibacteria bacterium]
MTLLGWTLLTASLGLVWGLTGWCFYKILTLPPEEREVPEPVQDFHSA